MSHQSFESQSKKKLKIYKRKQRKCCNSGVALSPCCNWLKIREKRIASAGQVVTGETFHVYLHFEFSLCLFSVRYSYLMKAFFSLRCVMVWKKKLLGFECKLKRFLLNWCLIYVNFNFFNTVLLNNDYFFKISLFKL